MGAIGPESGWNANAPQQYPVNAQFYINLGMPKSGSTDEFQGPVLDISGQATGSLTGPGVGGSAWRWSGGYSGTAASATLDPGFSQNASQLPAPLLDTLQHPDHFSVSVVATGGDMNYLDVTLTLATPSPTELPEPTALVTLVAGSAALMLRRWEYRAEK
jgi:hypothetical protein